MKDTLTLHWDTPLTIEVERKKIRNMYLHVRPGGRVSISAPLSLTDDEIASFAATRADWIKKQIRLMPAEDPGMPRYDTGGTIELWGVPYEIVFLPDKTPSLSFAEGRALLTMPGASSSEARERFVTGQLKLRLTRAVAMRMPYWEKEMGLHARGFSVRNMKTRWGVCDTAKERITFNLQLVKLDSKYLDYIIVHELAHLRHRRHDAAFWSLVAQYLPECKDTRKALNEFAFI